MPWAGYARRLAVAELATLRVNERPRRLFDLDRTRVNQKSIKSQSKGKQSTLVGLTNKREWNTMMTLCYAVCLVVVSGLLSVTGCAWKVDTARNFARVTTWGSDGIEVQRRKQNRLAKPLNWLANTTGYGGMQPEERTQLFLRTNALEEDWQNRPVDVLLELRRQTRARPDLTRLHVLADLAYVQGHRNRLAGNEQFAGRMLATAISASYEYLFDPGLNHRRNTYDPEFRMACDLYNQSLEGLLRIMKNNQALMPGGSFVATTLEGESLKVSIRVAGRWRDEDFDRFEFVSDYNTRGLRNVHHTYGLGVPLIAIRKSSDSSNRIEEKYYPADLSLPITAFVRPVPGNQQETRKQDSTQPSSESFQVQLIDPLEQTEVRVEGQYAPLESDISTPLAFYLDDPLLDSNWFATAALLNGKFASQFGGLYMLEPYDRTKIPVLMVHGFWSSPMTWTEMFNDLRADKSIRDNYQFWFYLYPSGQPFWFSARQMREDLANVRETLDPDGRSNALNEMVLVGHSMGGLVSRMQTIESGDEFWKLVSDKSINELKGDMETLQRIRDTLYFNSNPSISRVITLGTPHRGSEIATSLTRWLSGRLFTSPSNLSSEYNEVMKNNPGFFTSNLLKIATSTDSLAPDSMANDSNFFETLLNAKTNSKVKYHNIMGYYESGGAAKVLAGSDAATDGVVSIASAMCPNATSEIEIPAEHSSVHQHPKAILEVRRILSEHLDKIYNESSAENQNGNYQVRPSSYDESSRDPRYVR